MSDDLEEFVCNEVASLCDADPKVLAQYIIALIGNGERNDALRASLDDKLKEFFDDQTAPFIDRLFIKLNSNNKKAPKEPSDRFNAYSDEEDDDGDRNFKHRRQRSEPRDDRTDFSEQNKRRYADENPQYSNKHFRGNNGDDRRNPYNIPSGATGGYSSYDRGRGRAGAGRGYSGPNRAGTKPPMCRDYIEKGYCMKGDVCPYDHGRDRIIVEDANKNTYMPSMPTGGSVPTMVNRSVPNQQFLGMTDAYDPERASLLPTNPALSNDMRGPMQQRRGGHRGGGRGGRVGFRHQNSNPTNTTLTVEKIPPEFCQISTVNEFFAKFGTITNISVQPHAQKAIIQYSTRAEAEKAYTCPDAVFDNRFVKVYWNKDETVTAPATGTNAVTPATASTEESQQSTAQKRKAAEPDPELVAARAAELAKIREEKHKKHQEHMKTILEIQKKREQQLQQQIAEQKRLLDKLSNSSNMGTEEKAEILKQLKSIQSAIESNQNQAAAPFTTATTDAATTDATTAAETADSKEQASAELQKKLEHLEAEAAMLGVNTGSSYPGRGGYYGRGRGGWPRSRGGFTRMTLDNRPTKIVIKDIPEGTTEEELRQHFEQYGQISLFEKSDSEASVQYTQRFLAEKAMSYGPNFAKGKLQLSWSSEPKSETAPSTTMPFTETS
ncbi:hypothetical protein G6F57_007813 [Rhizopus arrhizus]|uniref:RNA-binding protein 26 n=1 Tax=Rhizopus oryzae TaxID=64495 RepID=A0A9P6X3K9_RHIOR|nr:hypothetical protein G6F23_004993 [Rhizopus arrhizus]KAG1420321.1 hypothetical protein G6F58_004234 [Rhizopus delemar]KAG0761465.1 hypothetical protein G6F24_007543 [Rhizopus arrhizus]KAG0789086.1 hypothetical protein G6F21_006759 [Rhizopus arrhizus]KAG0812504.1 hypothetical protein G6F20_006313 [Rhizopus arrhizus]